MRNRRLGIMLCITALLAMALPLLADGPFPDACCIRTDGGWAACLNDCPTGEHCYTGGTMQCSWCVDGYGPKDFPQGCQFPLGA